MHKIWENWLEALRIGGPGENLLHPSLPLQRGVGGGGAGKDGARIANEGAKT